MKNSLYDTLGVNKNASKEDIKSAYREKSKENHPDKGGDKDKMADISKAYSILSNDSKRNRYDTTGQENDTPFEQKFMSLIAAHFTEIINRSNVDNDDLIKIFKAIFSEIEKNIHKAKSETNATLKKYENVRSRIKSKNDNAIILFLDSQIKSNKNRIFEIEEESDFLAKARLVLEEYNYNFDEMVEEEQEWQTIIITNTI